MITFFTTWTNSPNLEYTSHLLKNVMIYCRPRCPRLGGAIVKESAFWLITHRYFVTHSKTLYPRIHWIVLNLVIWANLLFQTPPRQFHRFPWNFAHSICELSWQKVIKRMLIFQTILKLLNNNFLYILLKTQSVAYLHIGLHHEPEFSRIVWCRPCQLLR